MGNYTDIIDNYYDKFIYKNVRNIFVKSELGINMQQQSKYPKYKKNITFNITFKIIIIIRSIHVHVQRRECISNLCHITSVTVMHLNFRTKSDLENLSSNQLLVHKLVISTNMASRITLLYEFTYNKIIAIRPALQVFISHCVPYLLQI